MYRLSSSIASIALRFVAILLLVLTFGYGQSSPHGPIKIACINCHTTEGWKVLAKPMKFDHTTTGFSLQGAHANAQCIQCHTTKKFTSTPTDCFKCHTADFNKALSPNHQLGKFSHDCLSCHNLTGWKPSIFQHSKTNFQLVGAHLSVDCASCHSNNKYSGLSQDCYSCHQKVFTQTTAPNHKKGQFSHDCLTCHTINAWKPATFDHNKTNFRLVGAHASVECSSCHTGGSFKAIQTDCYSCHGKDYVKTTLPNHVTGQLSHDCLTCHTNITWKPSTFDHNKTSFQLVGAHNTVDCASCHVGGKFKGLAKDCFGCHQKDFAKAIMPNHSVMQLSENCLNCHTNISWKPATFDHNKTNFRLTGAHLAAPCASCHGGKQVKSISTECFSCHQQEFTKAVKPNHSLGRFTHDCLTCHTNSKWNPSTFDHNKTNFQLAGAHKTADCSSCHSTGQFKGLPSDCFSCHQSEFNSTTTPSHVTSQFSHDCMTCHSNVAWKPATFNHSTTSFPLVGAHVSATCASCHTNGVFKGLPSDCFSCHQNKFNSTTNPNHAAAQFSHDCLSCHSTVAWTPSTFNHNTTSFPLVGAHISASCASCHTNGVFKGLPSDCFSCHQNNFNSTTNPNHTTAQFSHDCLTCHSTIAWKPSTFNHNTTLFPLVGAHVSATCASCHTNGVFKGLPSDCFSCHQNNFNTTTNPNHVTSQFSHDCLTCHSTIAWKPATFNHSTTSFPLLGAHNAVACIDCHKNNQYKGTPTLCYDCHLSDFNGTTAPNHVSSQFSHDCLTCHSNVAWKPATFNHNTTAFPLLGAHISASCGDCHKNGQYKGTSKICFDCHLTDYNASTNPAHASAHYPTDCMTCHTTTAWKPSSFNHATYFPIGTGDKHRPGRWTTCQDCHENPSNFQSFTCITCHEHSNKASVDKDHQGKTGYVYESTACYKCHPRGN